MQDPSYAKVQERTAEEILATVGSSTDGALGEYLRVAAQVRTNQELTSKLDRASTDSGKLQHQIVVLTRVLAAAAVAQFLATDWQNLVWTLNHWILRQ